MANLSQEQLRRLARLGAMARLEQLRQEEAAIRQEFPELFGRGRAPRGDNGGAQSRRGGAGAKAEKAGRKMSAANRKAVSERMKQYWAERRKAKAGK